LLLVSELGMCSELEPSPIASKEKTQSQEEALGMGESSV
jgi:hypothetical protein